MTEAMPFLQKYDITFLRPPTIPAGVFSFRLRADAANPVPGGGRGGGLAPAVPDNPAAVVPEGEFAPGGAG